MKLYEFCNMNLVDEKIFIVPTKSIGIQISNRMAMEGKPCINLKQFTMKGLAFEICENYLNKYVNLIVDNIIGTNIIMGILLELSTDINFFFQKELIDARTSEEIYRAIMELKYAGIKEFPNIKDLDIIYEKYKLKLKELKAFDHCDIITKATEICVDNSYKIGIASNMELNHVEEQLLKSFSGGNFTKIQMPVSALEGHPRGYLFKEYISDYILKTKQIMFHKRYGIKEEINFVIEDIKNKLIPLDNVIIAYTNEKYIDLINLEFEMNNLSINFGSGVGIENSSAYRFITILFNWAGKYYSLNELRPLFFGNDISLSYSLTSLYEYLLDKKIVFGRKNYFEKLNLDGIKDIDLKNCERDKIASEFFYDIFSSIPEEKNFEFGKYIIKLQNLIEKYVKDTNKYDGASKDVILKTLSQIENIHIKIDVTDYFDIILSYIRKNRISRSGPQPGFVFATDINNGGYSGRENLYLIGMDSDSLSNKVIESPILLDVLRSKLSQNLKYANDSYNSKKYKIKELLTADFKNISIVYSNFDTVEIKGKAPSQIYSELMEICISIEDIAIEEDIELYGRDIVKSGSAFEVLASCPRKAYLSYKMGIKPREEREIRVEYWLDPLERGILVHNILNRFFDLEDYKRVEEQLRGILNEECEILRKEKSSILEKVFLREVEKVFDICSGMINNSKLDMGWEVLVNELTFGNNKNNKIFGIIPTVKIMMQGLELEIIGAIDRIDVNNSTKEIRIIDYKTGNKINFEKQLRENMDYSNTKKIQYYIYKKALEEIIKSNPIYKDYNIIKFSYIFDNSMIDILFNEEFVDVIEKRISDLLNMNVLIEQRNISYDPANKETCMYCDYSPICIVDRNIQLASEGVEN